MSTADHSGRAPRERSPLSDERIERLLTRYFQREMPDFQREMPAGLRSEPASALSPIASRQVSPSHQSGPSRSEFALASPPATQPPERSSGGMRPEVRSEYRGSQVVGLVAAASVLLATGWLLVSLSGSPDLVARSKGTGEGARTLSGNPADLPVVDQPVADLPIVVLPSSGDRRVEYSVTERNEPIETRTLDTDHGPVEQRSQRRVTNVSVINPESASQVEVEFPEVTVEIFPIRSEPAKKTPAKEEPVKKP